MADTKISALTAVTAPAATDEFAVNQGGVSKKMTLAQARANAMVSVRDHGAVGDGSANDAAAFTAAVAAAGSGGTVYVPDGTYRFAAKWTCTASSVRFLLARGATIKLGNAVNDKLWQIEGNDVTIEGGAFDGNRANQSSNPQAMVSFEKSGGMLRGQVLDVEVKNGYGSGLVFAGVKYGRIDHCYVHDINDRGIYVTNYNAADTADYNEIVGCRVAAIANGQGIGYNAANTTNRAKGGRIIGNHVEKATNSSLAIEVFGGSDSMVVADNVCVGFNFGISMDHADRAAVTGNTTIGVSGTVIGIELAGCRYAVVTGNAIDHTATAGSGSGVSCSDAAGTQRSQKCAVTGNSIKGAGAVGVLAYKSDDFTVNGNIVEGVDSAGSSGIFVQGGVRASVVGNTVSGFNQQVKLSQESGAGGTDMTCTGNVLVAASSQNGVQLQNATDAIVSDNRIIGTGTTGTGVESANSSGVNVASNRISGFSTGVNFWGTGDNYVASDNRLAGNTTAIGASASGTNKRFVGNDPNTNDTSFRHVGGSTPTGGQSGDQLSGTGKLWVNDGGTWKSATVT